MPFSNLIKFYNFRTFAEQLGYSKKDILVIVNIDDVGLHNDVSLASFNALRFGIVKSGSIMVPCPDYDNVINNWRDNPDYDFGIHLTLTCEWGDKYPWRPVLSKNKVPGLFNPSGIMWPDIENLLLHANKAEIEMELEAQIIKVLDSGLKPSHIDFHMDFHHHSFLLSIIIELSRKYSLIIRSPKRTKFRFPFIKNNINFLRRRGYIFPNTQMGTYLLGDKNLSFEFRKNIYHSHLKSLKPGIHNIKVHIAYHTPELQYILGDHFASIRHFDYKVWTSNETKQLANDLGIIFINYRPLQKLQKNVFLM